jgi:hypothetical protein
VNGIYSIVVSNIGWAASSGQIDALDLFTQVLAIPSSPSVSGTGADATVPSGVNE